MWSVPEDQLMHSLLGAGGENLARFVDGLIRAEASRGGLTQDCVHTQVRANIPDGGVDTHVEKAVPQDGSGWLGEPTCWQYKAQKAADISEPALRKEINSSHVRKLIQSGRAYRFCIAGDLTDPKRNIWEHLLLEESRKISKDCATPRVLAIDKIAAWARRFPFITSMVIRLPPGLFGFGAWEPNVTAITATYVKVDRWANIGARILSHADLSEAADEPCLEIQGEAGVGKTRLVFEQLNQIESAEALVAYTDDDQIALATARQMANSPQAEGILVADECPLETRMRLNDTLRGHRHRVRVIAIDNQGQTPPTGAPFIWLERIPQEVVEEILAENFPKVPGDRRRVARELASGFIRFAADLCHHFESGEDWALETTLGGVDDYLRSRLEEADFNVTLSLHKIDVHVDG